MNILAFESSCDETAAAVVTDGRVIRSNIIASSVETHALYGGVVPELASRAHVEAIVPVATQALADAGMTLRDIDAIATTYAPGLIGAVLVGVNFAKSAALAAGKPLVPVHHVRGHIAALYLTHPGLKPPFLCLCVSGGTTAIVHVEDYTRMTVLGSTRDDAVGECFDKVARVLNLPYPGGKYLDELAQSGCDTTYSLPHAHVTDAPMDLSFSGLKTAVINLIHNAHQKEEALSLPDLAASFSKAVSDSLIPRVLYAVQQTGCTQIAVAGGVAANSRIRADLEASCAAASLHLFLPALDLCGDNAAMIAAQGYYELLAGHTAGPALNAYATRDLSLG